MSRYYEADANDDSVEIVEPSESNESQEPTPPRPQKPKTKAPKTNFATLNTLASSSDDDEEEGQAFYAGGSEHSGQQVLGPSKTKDFVAGMFKSVQK